MYSTGKYSEAQIVERYDIPRQTVWAILKRSKRPNQLSSVGIKQQETAIRRLSCRDKMEILNRMNWNAREINTIWNVACKLLRKRCPNDDLCEIKFNGQVYNIND
jgi:hypothetical protein